MNKWEIVEKEYNKLNEELRKFIYEYLEYMELYWDELCDEDKRKFHVRVLSFIAPEFAKALGEWMEEAWKDALTYTKQEYPDEPDWEKEHIASEIAFRDFHERLKK